MKHDKQTTEKKRKLTSKTWAWIFFEKPWTWKNLELQAPFPTSTQGKEEGGNNLKSMNQNDDETNKNKISKNIQLEQKDK